MKLPKKIQAKLQQRKQENALRILPETTNYVDFSSNDYLGFAASETIFDKSHQLLLQKNSKRNGATGSRLLTGNHALYKETEAFISKFHNSEATLLYNSGYTANIGFFSSVPQRGDIVLYDAYIHASIRDGLTMSHARSLKFNHNDLADLEEKLKRIHKNDNKKVVYVVTEAVFSMDGDSPDLEKFVEICQKYNAYTIVDEAHSLGVYGENGQGLLQKLRLEDKIFARIYTFGKALGCHGAAILGSSQLKEYLINFSRSLIYTTALSPHAVATIKIAYEELAKTTAVHRLRENIQAFQKNTENLEFIKGNAAIQCCVISGIENVINVAETLQNAGFDVKPIVSPTVRKGQERLRFCLHSYNTLEEIENVTAVLKKI